MITLDEIRARAGKSRLRLGWSRILLGLYSLFAALCMIYFLIAMWVRNFPIPGMTAIVIAFLATNLWILFALWRRRPRRLPLDMAAAAALDFQRQELERQHTAARSAWAWYILPFVPVTVLAFLVNVPMLPPDKVQGWIFSGTLVNVCWYSVIWLFFSRSAARIELELHRLGRLRAE